MEKKKILLRLDPKLHEALKRWADEEFRSLNSHIEFLLKKSLSSNRPQMMMNEIIHNFEINFTDNTSWALKRMC